MPRRMWGSRMDGTKRHSIDVADDSESNTRVKVTVEDTRLGPRRRLGRCRTDKCNQRCTKSQCLDTNVLSASSASKSIIDAASEGMELVSAYARADHLRVKIFAFQGPVGCEAIFHAHACNDARAPGGGRAIREHTKRTAGHAGD